MKNAYRVVVPSSLDHESALQFSHTLLCLPDEDDFLFDFSKLGHVEPFGMLYASTAIRLCRKARLQARFQAINFSQCTYAGHMGFFQTFGLDFGKSPGEAPGGNTYLPITRLEVATVTQEAAENQENVNDAIERRCATLAKILTQKDGGDLVDALTYSFREMFRNVAEHSESTTIDFCAQYWPSKDTVELAILDTGVGIRQTLSANPHLRISNDSDALKLSLMPGVSGKVFKGAKQNLRGAWGNSGYGLYMTSRICRNGGSFLIASGASALILQDEEKTITVAGCRGTALRLVINTQQVEKLSDMLARFRLEGREAAEDLSGVDLSASLASRMLSRDFR